MIALAVASTACGPGSARATHATNTSSNGKSSGSSESNGNSESSGSSTSEGTGPSTETTTDTPPETDSETGGCFDDPCGNDPDCDGDFNLVSCCSFLLQDCPGDEKCVPYSPTGQPEAFGRSKCVPLSGDGLPGEACMSGGIVEGTDDCGAGSFCFGYDFQTLEGGTCHPFCSGTVEMPECMDGWVCELHPEVEPMGLPYCVPA